MLKVACLLLVGLFAAKGTTVVAPAQTAQAPIPKALVFKLYWSHVQAILRAEEARPKPNRDVQLRYPPPRKFAFDAFRHLSTKDLIIAAQQGVISAQKRSGRMTPQEENRQVAANIRDALEYYPLLAENDDDLVNLLHVIENPSSEPGMRIYLIERCATGMAPPNLLSMYLQDHLRTRQRKMQKILLEILSGGATVPPEVQLVAMEALYRFLHDQYMEVLLMDPAVKERAEQTGNAITPRFLREEEGLLSARNTSILLTRLNQTFQDVACAYTALLNPAIPRSAAFKDEVRRQVRRIVEEIPIPNPAIVEELLNKHSAEAPQTD